MEASPEPHSEPSVSRHSGVDGMVVATAERRHGPLREVLEIVVAATVGHESELARADRVGFAAAQSDGRPHGVVAANGRYAIVRLCPDIDPDVLRLVGSGPQLMTWCRPDGLHPLMRGSNTAPGLRGRRD